MNVRPAVVVQVDATSEDALDWAAAEASARGLPLRLVHPVDTPPSVDPWSLLSPTAAGTLGAALARARAVDSGLAVETRLVPGTARQVLLQESRTAALLVLDTSSPAALGRLLPGRAPLQLAAAAACPVTVVRGLSRGDEPRPRPRVVVGIDGAPSSGAALGFAVRAAHRRAVPLTVLHAWTADPPADLEGSAPAASRRRPTPSAWWNGRSPRGGTSSPTCRSRRRCAAPTPPPRSSRPPTVPRSSSWGLRAPAGSPGLPGRWGAGCWRGSPARS
ncbi:universal stress protein [Blastococcus brunescens]|uniref:Universal stress protein n=1 Tax=Blastococcus brunescens TaxID=1564165 RepID=A0ABZ1B4Y1_9ACTN|nr:universal stress protein [Blastococcus sp. BMG 8361]WRL65859.1 universal stress protein [Blastococcus sp. BMG 8361]